MPELDRYWAACVYSEKQRGDDLLQLGQSLNVRLHRALELRDAIGGQFYQRQNNYTRDYMMANLEYWALMVSGALDAQARMTIRAYELPLREQTANFRDLNIPVHLDNAGAQNLATVLRDARTRAMLTLCRQLRNTIHGASYTHVGTTGYGEPSSFVRVANADCATLLNAAQDLGDPAVRGFTDRLGGLAFEPYTFVHTLTDDVFRLIGLIASATDVSRFFPAGVTDEFSNPRPSRNHDDLFSPDTLADINLLG